MSFTENALEQLAEEFGTLQGKKDELYGLYIKRRYSSPEAEEFAKNGFLRRVKTIVRCIINVYELLPPEKTEIPENHTRHDAEINIQAHIFNVFGAVDNLAWVWVEEKSIKRENGKELR